MQTHIRATVHEPHAHTLPSSTKITCDFPNYLTMQTHVCTPHERLSGCGSSKGGFDPTPRKPWLCACTRCQSECSICHIQYACSHLLTMTRMTYTTADCSEVYSGWLFIAGIMFTVYSYEPLATATVPSYSKSCIQLGGAAQNHLGGGVATPNPPSKSAPDWARDRNQRTIMHGYNTVLLLADY